MAVIGMLFSLEKFKHRHCRMSNSTTVDGATECGLSAFGNLDLGAGRG
jgi:hypothetical protein